MRVAGRWRVDAESDRLGCAAEVRERLLAAGVPRGIALRAELCAAELYGNAARHAKDGELEVLVSSSGVEIWARDRGPGIADVPRALEDGVSAGQRRTPDTPLRELRGMGTGLGAIARHADQLTILPRDGGGLLVRAALSLAPHAKERR